MIWTCSYCNRSYPTNGEIVRCICNCKNAISTSQREDYLPCMHRGEAIREINCGCNGKPKIYSCDLHKTCYLRKLSKMPPESISNATMCLMCDDRKRFKSGKLGIAGVVHNSAGGTETYWRLLAKTIGISGFAVTDPPVSKSPHYPVFDGDAALEELASKVEYLIVWGITDKAKQTEGPIRVAMHHGSLASTWANSVFEDELKWCEKAVAINPEVAKHYGVPCIENCIDTEAFSLIERNTHSKTVLWLHRDAIEKRPELVFKIAEKLPKNWNIIASLPKEKSINNVKCIGYTSDVAGWLKKSSVFLSTSEQEGFGFSVAEAMAAGIPVVSSPVGICLNPDICEQVTSDDPSDWANAIIKAGSKAHYARDYIKINYGLDQWIEQWQELINHKVELPIKIPKKVYIGEGPGTELKKLLSWFANDTPTCKCLDRAKTMNTWGPEGCKNNLDTILDWLEKESENRNLPFMRIVAKQLVLLAISRAEKCIQKDASSST